MLKARLDLKREVIKGTINGAWDVKQHSFSEGGLCCTILVR